VEVRANYWIEIDGKVVLSDWRARLLEAIADSGSLSEAARRMTCPITGRGTVREWRSGRERDAGHAGRPPRRTGRRPSTLFAVKLLGRYGITAMGWMISRGALRTPSRR